MGCFFLVSFGLGHTADSSIKEPHQFSEKECQICHIKQNINILLYWLVL